MSAPVQSPAIVTPLTHGEALDLAAARCALAAAVICPPHHADRCSFCTDLAKLLMDVDAASRAQTFSDYHVAEMVTALRDIREGVGAFSPDALTHAANVIDRNKSLATAVLEQIERLLCGPECVQRYGHDGPHDDQEPGEERAAPAAPPDAKTIDLMEALKKSLAERSAK